MKDEVAQIVSGYLRRNAVAPDQLPSVIEAVYTALTDLGKSSPPATFTPAVPIKRAVQAESITCLDCGLKSKMLKRHLRVAHGLTANQYRTRWSLPHDYPMVARNYSAHRSELAKARGLGRLGRLPTS